MWKSEINAKYSSEDVHGRVHLEDKGVDGRVMLRVIINSVKGCGLD
jgi:hypothetical protein